MTWPWISRSAHLEIRGLLEARIRELEARERLLLDRVVTAGTGEALFDSPATEPEEAEPVEEQPVSTETATIQRLLQMRRRPSRLADALTRNSRRKALDHGRARVAWVPQEQPVTAAQMEEWLDRAESAGRN